MNVAKLVTQKTIRLNDMRLHDGNLKELAEVLRKNQVEVINLCSNQIDLAEGESIDAFINALADNRSIVRLALTSNRIADEGAKRLAFVLKHNHSLREIHLYDNDIGDAGARDLADALIGNGALQVLGLANNHIGDAGAESLAHAFAANRGLRKVWLYKNSMGRAGAAHLTAALRCNRSLETFRLEYGRTSAAVLTILQDPWRKERRGEACALEQLEMYIAIKQEQGAKLGSATSAGDEQPNAKRPRAAPK